MSTHLTDMCGFKFINIIFLNLFIILLISNVQAKQLSSSSCFYELDDGRILDISPLSKGIFYSGNKNTLSYYFLPCANDKLFLNDSKNATQNCNTEAVSLCSYDETNHTITNLGKTEESNIVPSEKDKGLFDIIYTNKNKIKTVITLSCSNLDETVLHIEHDTKHDLILYSPYACPIIKAHSLSNGSLFVIIFLIFTCIYFFGGAFMLYFLRGARGREMIPNIDFWTSLPLLVRDGVTFLQNGCKPPPQQGETYDRI